MYLHPGFILYANVFTGEQFYPNSQILFFQTNERQYYANLLELIEEFLNASELYGLVHIGVKIQCNMRVAPRNNFRVVEMNLVKIKQICGKHVYGFIAWVEKY